ncbi:MAG: energy transducer TonB [Desulfuromonadaceae bacterium]|nr:energy transducer TonB [Desulfuromonadaceae bacterium]MDD2855552.1 energy transducer TonB [Desulfuromonadaceae bacterium]
MSDKYIEKSFLLLLCLSFLLHAGLFAGLYFMRSQSSKPPEEPVFIDLQQIPAPQKPLKKEQEPTKRRSEQRVRVSKESSPRGDAAKDSQTSVKPNPPSAAAESPAARQHSKTTEQQSADQSVAPGFSASGLLKPRNKMARQLETPTNLFPGVSRLAKLEEGYRHKFENDIAEGDTRFLNSDDIVFGSFLRRFEGAIYGVWRYPQEAALRGIEGITPVRITFNRRGEITNIIQLESSGAHILDEEVLRTLRAIGPVGGFPKGYDKEEFHLIAFFQYGGSGRSLK